MATATVDASQGMSVSRPTSSPWMIAVSVMLATFMKVLDTSIASVALPYIAGSLSASNDEATWVLTSYLVANAVILPAKFLVCIAVRAQALPGSTVIDFSRISPRRAPCLSGERACGRTVLE